MFEGKIEIIPGSNPHRLNSIARNEIEDGAAEAPDNGKRTPTSSEKKNGRKGRDNTAQVETKKKDRTLQDEATAFQDSKKKGADKQSQREQPQPRRETKPLQTGGTESQGNGDDKNLGRKPPDDQQRRRGEHDTDENRSPNLGSTAPRSRDFQGVPTSPTSQMNTPQWSPGTQGNVPQTTSDSTSLRQVWDASLHPGTARGQDGGIPQGLQALSGAVPHFGATQGRDHDTQGQGNCSQPAYPSTSQQLFATQPLHSQTRSHATQRNIPPTGGAYASPQSQQHSSYPQQTSQRSARGRGHSQGNTSHQSYAAQQSRQAQAKDRGGNVSLGEVTATGYF